MLLCSPCWVLDQPQIRSFHICFILLFTVRPVFRHFVILFCVCHEINKMPYNRLRKISVDDMSIVKGNSGRWVEQT